MSRTCRAPSPSPHHGGLRADVAPSHDHSAALASKWEAGRKRSANDVHRQYRSSNRHVLWGRVTAAERWIRRDMEWTLDDDVALLRHVLRTEVKSKVNEKLPLECRTAYMVDLCGRLMRRVTAEWNTCANRPTKFYQRYPSVDQYDLFIHLFHLLNVSDEQGARIKRDFTEFPTDRNDKRMLRFSLAKSFDKVQGWDHFKLGYCMCVIWEKEGRELADKLYGARQVAAAPPMEKKMKESRQEKQEQKPSRFVSTRDMSFQPMERRRVLQQQTCAQHSEDVGNTYGSERRARDEDTDGEDAAHSAASSDDHARSMDVAVYVDSKEQHSVSGGHSRPPAWPRHDVSAGQKRRRDGSDNRHDDKDGDVEKKARVQHRMEVEERERERERDREREREREVREKEVQVEERRIRLEERKVEAQMEARKSHDAHTENILRLLSSFGTLLQKQGDGIDAMLTDTSTQPAVKLE